MNNYLHVSLQLGVQLGRKFGQLEAHSGLPRQNAQAPCWECGGTGELEHVDVTRTRLSKPHSGGFLLVLSSNQPPRGELYSQQKLAF